MGTGAGELNIDGHVPDGVRPFEDIPGPNSLQYMLEFHRVSEGFTKGYRLLDIFFAKYGPIFKENVLVQGSQTVHVTDPDDFERIFRAEGKYPQRPPIDIWVEYRKRRNYFFLGVFSSNDEEWKRIRQSIAPKVMRPKIVEENIENFNAVADDAIARFVKLNEVSDDHLQDLKGELSRWSTESIGTVAFDSRLGLYEDPPSREALRFIEEVHNFFTFSHKLLFSVTSRFVRRYVDTPTLKKFWKTADAVHEIGQGFVDRKMKELKEMADKGIDPSNNTKVVSVLTYLLTRGDLTPEEVNGHAIDVVIGGVDTTSVSALWFLYNLARFPEVQEKLYQEVDSVEGKSDVTTENLTRLPYLKACLKESMRLTPVANSVPRILDQDVVLSGYNVPAKTGVMMEWHCTARSEKYFKDPLEMKPERWLRENKDKTHAFSALPFGFGTRMCLGRRLAELEMYVFVCKLLQRFRLEYHHEPLDSYQRLILEPDKPVKIKFVDRC